MKYKRFKDKIVLRLEVREDIAEELAKLANIENIKLASVSGIGATNDFSVGVFDPEKGSYDRFDHKGDHEITALVGNITTMDGKPYLHLHITCAASDGTVCAGHLIQGRISLTAEIVIDIIEGELIRKRSEELNINLIDFE